MSPKPWTPASAGERPRTNEYGFTLIELLVALVIFAMLAAAGVLLLGNSVSAQGAIRGHLDGMAAIQRTNGALTADLAQAVPRISRTENGLLAPAFFAQQQGENAPVMQFVRAGWTNMDESPRPTLQKVEYWVRQGRLERRTYPLVDGAQGAQPATLLEGIDGAVLRFRDARGDWRDNWASTQPDLLPRAVEIVLSRTGAPSLTLKFLVGPGPAEKQDEAEAPVNG
ncbi:MAG: type II secretion system minor pseudopilin GspJ [Sphingobium phenoxybenzoativorans]